MACSYKSSRSLKGAGRGIISDCSTKTSQRFGYLKFRVCPFIDNSLTT